MQIDTITKLLDLPNFKVSKVFEHCENNLHLDLDLVGRNVIQELEGTDDKYLDEYATAGSERNLAMIEIIASACT